MVQDEERARLGQANLSSRFHWEWTGQPLSNSPRRSSLVGEESNTVVSTALDLI